MEKKLVRKAEILNVLNSDDEFEIKTKCNRRKSLDFQREKKLTMQHNTVRGGSLRKRRMTMVKRRRKDTLSGLFQP